MSYKYLLFDADNTLFDFDKCEEYAFLSMYDVLPSVFTPVNLELYHNINDKLWKEAEKGKVTKEELKIERFRQLLSKLEYNEDLVTPEELSLLYIERLSQQNELIDGAVEILAYLYPKYAIYIITNGISTVQKSRLSISPIKSFVKSAFISEDIGFNKPDQRYFQTVMNIIGSLNTSDYLVIGDSLTSDIKGAENVGIDSVYFCKRPSSEFSNQAKYSISSLEQLRDIL